MEYEDITNILYNFGFTDIGKHDETIYGEKKPSRVIATLNGLVYHHIIPTAVRMIDVGNREYECTVRFTCDKTVAKPDNPYFRSLDISIRRHLSFFTAVRLDNWFHGL
jgi:hypothetical protein